MDKGTLFLICLIVFFVILRLIRRRAGAKPKSTITASVSTSSNFESEESDLGPLTPRASGEWLLNPKSSFPLCIYGVDSATAQKVKLLCDEKRFSGVDALKGELIPVIARSNLRCKEVDEYVSKFKPQYLSNIKDYQQSSTEWADASERDRADLLISFREKAIQALDVQPDCDLVALFENEPKDTTLDDALLDRYGYKTLQTYFRYSSDLKRVYQVPSDYRGMRDDLEKLADCGLAGRGKDIPLASILEILKLKEMKEVVADKDTPKWSRKSQAIEFLLGVPEIKELIGKRIAYRELFQLKRFPPEFSHINIQDISTSWRHAEAVATLIARTYVGGSMCARDLFRDQKYKSKVTAWRWINDGTPCPHCKRIQETKNSFVRRPKTPLHIGCRCWIEADYEDEFDS